MTQTYISLSKEDVPLDLEFYIGSLRGHVEALDLPWIPAYVDLTIGKRWIFWLQHYPVPLVHARHARLYLEGCCEGKRNMNMLCDGMPSFRPQTIVEGDLAPFLRYYTALITSWESILTL